MRNRDWTLLVIAAANGKSLTPVQLQKSLFLLSRNLNSSLLQRASLYEFEPYDYGPFDSSVYRDAEALREEGLVTITPGGPGRTYSITPKGLEEALTRREGLDAISAKYLDDVVNWILPKSFGDLVRAIYNSYPEMRARSVFNN